MKTNKYAPNGENLIYIYSDVLNSQHAPVKDLDAKNSRTDSVTV